MSGHEGLEGSVSTESKVIISYVKNRENKSESSENIGQKVTAN